MSTSSSAFRTREVAAGAGTVHVVEAGDPGGEPFLFLHGWPESWRSWERVLTHASADGVRAIAIDLPGIGGSVTAATDGTAKALAGVVHEVLAELEVERPTIVGHDAGGLVAYAYMREYPEATGRIVLLSIVIPGLEPWHQVLANPYVWHFAFHAIPGLPEQLVAGREHEYFGWFYDALAHNAAGLTPEVREAHVAAYREPGALEAGFDLYRALRRDEADNTTEAAIRSTSVPLLYLRGDHEPGDLASYVRGFHNAGVRRVRTGLVDRAGHFGPEESPESLWRLVHEFAIEAAPA